MTRPTLGAALVAIALAGCGGKDGPWLEDRAASAGIDFVHQSGRAERPYMPEIMGGGAALFDMDGDGDLDAYLVQSGDIRLAPAEQPPNQLYRNRGDGTFENATAGSGAEAPGYGQGVAAGDHDNDGDVDLYVTNVGPDILLRNDGTGRFQDVTAAAGIDAPGWGASATFLDYDRDGWLDLFVSQYLIWTMDKEIDCHNNLGQLDYCSPVNYGAPAPAILYRNRGDGTFEDRTAAAGVTAAGTGLGVVAGDFNADGWQDVFVANDGMANRLWLNGGDGTFQEKAQAYSVAIDNEGTAKAGMGTAAEDVDGDADLDLLVVNLVGESDSFFENQDGAFFVDRSADRKLSLAASRTFTRFGVGMPDLDNDGLLDMFQANGRVGNGRAQVEEKRFSDTDPYAEPDLLLRGQEDGSFVEQLPRGGTAELLLGTGRAAAFGDVDNDGGVDILVVNRDAPAALLMNRAPGRGGWVLLRVLDEHGRDALGATLKVTVGDRQVMRAVRSGYSYLAANDMRVHVGLGRADKVDSVEVTWVDGHTEAFGAAKGGQVVTLRQGEGRSSP